MAPETRSIPVLTRECNELRTFSCGDADLDEFFHKDAHLCENDFRFLYASEELEKEANHIDAEERLESRMMSLDLIGSIQKQKAPNP